LPLIPFKYIKDIFFFNKANNKFKELEDFINYYEKFFIKNDSLECWNYYNENTLRTNNPCEGYNYKLNSYFEKYLVFII